MKIPVQVKIAELERRIERLEKQLSSRQVVHTSQTVHAWDSVTQTHWNKMWAHFNAMMGRVFR